MYVCQDISDILRIHSPFLRFFDRSIGRIDQGARNIYLVQDSKSAYVSTDYQTTYLLVSRLDNPKA